MKGRRMSLIERVGRALVIAPHPDDEVLGCGGTMARLADRGVPVEVAIVTSGTPPRFSRESREQDRAEARRAHDILGVAKTRFLDLPAAELDRVPHADMNAALLEVVREAAPDTLLVPFGGDIHLDHQLVFLSTLVAARPNRAGYPCRVIAYETLSETNWHAPYLAPSFVPNLFVDIGDTLERKLAAMAAYEGQVKPFPDERSLKALEALATLRGATVRRPAAEAFVLLREVG
jgi:LmbE family N-acetylglucosaminyl deacetylase